MLQVGHSSFVALQLGQAVLDLIVEADHFRQAVAVLATQVAQQLQPAAHRVQPLRVFLDVLRSPTKIGGDILHFGTQATQSRLELGERRATGKCPDGGRDGVAGTALVGERIDRDSAQFAILHGASQLVELGIQVCVLLARRNRGRPQLSSLKRSRSSSRARDLLSPPNAASAASNSVRRARAARSGPRSVRQ